MKKHTHLWKAVETGIAICPENHNREPRAWRGYLEKCDCGARQFVTVDPRLPPVEIVSSDYYGPMK